MTDSIPAELVKRARGVLKWDEIFFGDMFGVEQEEVKLWEQGKVEIDDLVLTISDLIIQCQSRADLLHEIFDVPSLDEDGVLTLLRFLRDAIQSGEIESQKLEESLLDAIEMVLELSSYGQSIESESLPGNATREPEPEAWDV
ncbi:MAG: hypothetical protein P1V97_04440 [Planctomycetota bacterium]|nr:hypothetical protein [Planctomycetota bacterium]